jgi:S-adenosylmethionine hydrolase
VIYRIAPEVQIADITHSIRPQNIQEGGLVLNRAYRYFPEGSIHVIVVDPGVGTQRRPMAARLGAHFFVCPDNGLITPILQEAEKAGLLVEIVHLDQPRYWLPQVSSVFHGRDIFAPAAAHLANGVPLSELGSPIHDPNRLYQPEPQPIKGGLRGVITFIDHFGNLGTNITRQQFSGHEQVRVKVAGHEIRGLSNAFGDGQEGQLIALIDSDDELTVAVYQGSAAHATGAQEGDMVEVLFEAA